MYTGLAHKFFFNLIHSSSEIPQYRLPFDVVSFEMELMRDLGVAVSAIQNAHRIYDFKIWMSSLLNVYFASCRLNITSPLAMI